MSVELHFEPKLSPYIVGTQWTGMVNTSTFVIFQSVFAEGVMASIFLFLHETCNFKPLIFNKSSIILQCSLETSSPQEHFLFFPWHSIHIWWSFKQRYQRVFPGLGPFSHIWHRISVRIFETVLFKSSDSRDEAIFQIKPVKRKRNVRNFVYNWKTETTENSTPETTNSNLRTEISLIISSVLRVWTWKLEVTRQALFSSRIKDSIKKISVVAKNRLNPT